MIFVGERSFVPLSIVQEGTIGLHVTDLLTVKAPDLDTGKLGSLDILDFLKFNALLPFLVVSIGFHRECSGTLLVIVWSYVACLTTLRALNATV